MIALSIASIGAGFIVTYIGYYTPLMILGSVLMALGFGFLTTFNPNTGYAAWIGWQVAIGLGGGLSFSQPFTSVQTALVDEADIPMGMSAVVFANTLGGTLFISVAQNIFSNLLSERLASIPEINVDEILNEGATNLVKSTPAAQLSAVLAGYNVATTSTFWIGVGCACFGMVAALGMKWNTVKKEDEAQGEDSNTEAAISEKEKPGSD